MLRTVLLLGLMTFVYAKATFAQPVCNGTLSENSLPEGDFGAGATPILFTDPGLAPGYQYQNQPPPEDGLYTIASTTDFGANSFACWVLTGDNSNDPNGYMMIVNADFSPGIFFETSVAVCENTTYLFQADLINLIRADCTDAIFPNVDFLINGVVQFQTGDLPQDETWHTQGFSFTTTSGETEVILSLRNNAPGGGGNDLALDNISFYHCGPPAILPVQTEVCGGGTTTLNAQVLGMNYTNPHYRWQRSQDNGMSWFDIPDSDSEQLEINGATNGHRYRFLLADGTANLDQMSCRTASNSTLISITAPPEYFQSSFLCDGDTLFVGNQALTQGGNHQTIITHTNGCDSLIYTFIALLPSYDQIFTQSLCPGELFNGQTYERDTVLVQQFTAASGCDSTVHFEIDVFDIPAGSIAGATSVCLGESIPLSAPTGYANYLWSTGETSPDIEASAGDYTVQITNSGGCTVELSTSLIESNPFAEIALSDPTCPGASDGSLEVLFSGGGTGPYQYSIADLPFSDDTLLIDLPAGNFTFTIRDAEGCASSVDLLLQEADPASVNLQGLPNEAIPAGDSVALNLLTDFTPASIEWQADGFLSCRDCPNPIWVPFGEGRISYQLTTASGCVLQGSEQLRLLEPYRIYFPTAFSPNGDQVNDRFAPGMADNIQQVSQWEIYDRWGGQILSRSELEPSDENLHWDGNWRGKEMNTGVYFYRATILFTDGQSRTFAGEINLMR